MSDKLEPFTDMKSELSLRDEAIARIERRLDEISKQIDDIVRHMDKMCASWRSTRKRMNRMEAQLYGK